MKLARLLLAALLVATVLSAGCVGLIRDTYKSLVSTPTPTSSLPITLTPIPINQAIERQYMFAEKLNSGLEHYNSGIMAMNRSRELADQHDWSNASIEIGMAKAYMEQARASFLDMKRYAFTADEANLSEKWNQTAYYEAKAFEFVNLSYQEDAYQSSRGDEANYIRYNYYVSQANYYLGLAKACKAEAEELERRTFIGQQGQVI
ncbi:hypothetical protein [Methanocella conradii]|uniref:hypothetical protein n=1 Tax=Methanocella conradii TaxID=1175444 RepID=UPI00157C5B07|nr:hypothetical protein [Methanocella conradii]